MSHEIAQVGGQDSIAFTGKTPWHGLGQRLEEGAPMETWAKAAGMDFDIKRAEVRFTVPGKPPQNKLFYGREVLYRSDSEDELSIVSGAYKIYQPRETLEYFNELVQNAGFTMSTAGVLFGGRQFWALADIGESDAIIDPRDRVRGKLLVATSCDGTMPTVAKFVMERVVCANTLGIALSEEGRGTRIKHATQVTADKLNERMGIDIRTAYQKTVAQLRDLAGTEISQLDAALLTAQLFSPAVDFSSEAAAIKALKVRGARHVAQLGQSDQMIGGDLEGAGKGSLWGWLNSVTQYVDHELYSRSPDWKLQRAWFGDGSRLKSLALEYAVGFRLPAARERNEKTRQLLGDDTIMENILAPVPSKV